MKALSSTLSVFALCAVAAPAAADVSAADLWADWQANAAEAGFPISAQANPSGNGLTLSQMTWTAPETGTDPGVTFTFSDIIMTDQDDGSVSVSLPQPFQMVVEGNQGGDTLGRVVLELVTEGFDVQATGDMANLSYGVSAASMVLRLAGIEDFKGPQPEVDFEMSIDAFDALYRYIDTGDDRDFESAITTGPASFQMEVNGPPGDEGRVAASFEMGPSQTTSSGENITLLQNLAMMAEPGAVLSPNGTMPTVTYDSSYASVSYNMDVDVPGTIFQMSGSNAGGSISGGLGPDGVSMDIGASDAVISMRGNELPVPIDVSAAGTRVAFTLPAMAEPEPSDFAILLDYRDLVISDTLWSMVDPSGAIPREPVTVQLDLSGLAQMYADLIAMDPTTLAGPPGELRSATLNNLNVSAAGAELTGNGAVEFQPGMFPPMPVGRVDLGLEGLTGLMNALTMAGLLPAEQAMMAQAMVGMFARPGAGPDTLESTIEFTPGGGITANGTPIR